MKLLLVVAVIGATRVIALAQPSDPPVDPTAPAPAAEPPAPPPVAAPIAPAIAPSARTAPVAPVAPVAPARAAPVAPVAPVAPDPFADHHGVTFEANLGVAFGLVTGGGEIATSSASLAGLDLGLGGWLSPRLALTFRIAGIDFSNSGPDLLVGAFGGPSLQYWADPHFWIGGGAGLAVLAALGFYCEDNCASYGFGLDLRAGYAFGDGAHRFDLSAEITPGVYSAGTLAGFAVLLGYQFL